MSCHLPSALSDRGDASTDFEITVGNVKYLLIENQENLLQCADFDNDNGHILVLVYTIGPNDPIEKSALREFQASTHNRDDVHQTYFASNMVFYGFSEEGTILDPDTLAELRSWNGKKKHLILQGRQELAPNSVVPGPYVFLRVTVDAAYASHNGRVVVPSRCYYKPSKDRPLSGARFSVKDNINVAGQKTTLCNRAWTEFISVSYGNSRMLRSPTVHINSLHSDMHLYSGAYIGGRRNIIADRLSSDAKPSTISAY
ncbi:hypothetical protein BB8028_0002g09270 [Beauveria bassiana]|uniref:Uncharacterized protein n=1 Tax=Beauveria bassiana TaxID=176275 RepID=A0A2S7Y376_BEABA|nr:hypothetical protein BB8028_0002g09270 [Beauveria bassiana]